MKFYIVTLCCVISVQIEAYCLGEKSVMQNESIREERDEYRPQTVQLNGTNSREAFGLEANMFLLPTALKKIHEIEIIANISANPEWVSISLITGLYGPNGMEPDRNNLIRDLIDFPPHSSGNLSITGIVQGHAQNINNKEELSRGFFPDTTNENIVDFLFVIEDKIQLFFKGSIIGECNIPHELENYRYIEFAGNIEVTELKFRFFS